MSEKIKTPGEWKNIIGKLSPSDFEHLCYQLVRAMPGFENVDLREGSYDSGRDIDAVYRGRAPDGITEISETWRLECKKYSKGIAYDAISGKLHQADQNRVDKLVIMSNMHLTPDCKDEIAKIQNNLYCKILDWTGVHFQDILFQYPHICKEFFPEEEIPQQFLDTKMPQELIGITQKAGSHFGIRLEIKLKEGQELPKNIDESADIIKEYLLNLGDIDLNIKSLIYQQMSRLFFSINRKDDALLFIGESLRITPNNIAALLNKGFILDKLDELEESNECIDKVLKIDKYNKFALNNKAHNLNRKGDYEKALNFSDKALDIDPDFVGAIYNKASILTRLGKTEEALDFLDDKLKKFPYSIKLFESKVNLLIDLVDLKEAMRVNDRILDIDPGNIGAINNKGVIYEHNSRYQNQTKYLPLAMEWFEKAVDKDKNYPLAWSNKITCLCIKGLTTDAEAIVDSVLEIFPTNSHILHEKGHILLKKNKPYKALKFFNKALKYDALEKALLSKTKVLLLLHKNKEAIDTADEILKYNKKSSDAWAFKGIALRKLRQSGKANQCFQKAKEYKRVPKSLLE